MVSGIKHGKCGVTDYRYQEGLAVLAVVGEKLATQCQL